MIRWLARHWRRPLLPLMPAVLLLACLLLPSAPALAAGGSAGSASATASLAAAAPADGAVLFSQHCAGCHVNGGNPIRRRQTLKLAALQRNGINDPSAIARIAASGLGQMGGYAAVLGTGGPEAVGAWVWQQAQNAWIQG